MYVAKATNRTYMRKPLGKKIACWEKTLLGFCLVILVLALIAGPILLFSTLNPISVLNPVTAGTLSVQMEIYNKSSGVTTKSELFSTSQLTNLIPIT